MMALLQLLLYAPLMTQQMMALLQALTQVALMAQMMALLYVLSQASLTLAPLPNPHALRPVRHPYCAAVASSFSSHSCCYLRYLLPAFLLPQSLLLPCSAQLPLLLSQPVLPDTRYMYAQQRHQSVPVPHCSHTARPRSPPHPQTYNSLTLCLHFLLQSRRTPRLSSVRPIFLPLLILLLGLFHHQPIRCVLLCPLRKVPGPSRTALRYHKKSG